MGAVADTETTGHLAEVEMALRTWRVPFREYKALAALETIAECLENLERQHSEFPRLEEQYRFAELVLAETFQRCLESVR